MSKKITKYTLIITSIFLSIFFLFGELLREKEILIKNELIVKKTSQKSKKEKDITELFNESIDLSYYRKYYNNKEIIARLEIPNLLNILITKTSNNDYYLNHSIDKKYDTKGTEYMDFRVNPLSKQINIYGHNSRTYDLSFRKLENFLNEEFFQKNEYILLQHDNGYRIYQIFSIKKVRTDYTHMNVEVKENNFKNHIQKLQNNSLYSRKVEYNELSNILVLQTCSYEKEISFYIICALEITIDTK